LLKAAMETAMENYTNTNEEIASDTNEEIASDTNEEIASDTNEEDTSGSTEIQYDTSFFTAEIGDDEMF